MVSERKVFSQLNNLIKANKIPAKLTDDQRSVLTRRFSRPVYKSFPFTGSSKDSIYILNGFTDALKWAEAIGKDLIEPYYYIDYYGRRECVHVSGYFKQTDIFLIQKYVKYVEEREKQKQKIKQQKQEAKKKLASTTKYYSIKSDELARLVKQLINVGKSK
jgi:hypothetical protein